MRRPGAKDLMTSRFAKTAMLVASIGTILSAAGCGGTGTVPTSSSTTLNTRPSAATTTAPPAVTTTTSYADRAAASQAAATTQAYAQATWCSPLAQASGRSLQTLHAAVTAEVDKLGWGAQGPAATGQVAVGQTPPQHLADLATAMAVIPPGEPAAAVTLHLNYCEAHAVALPAMPVPPTTVGAGAPGSDSQVGTLPVVIAVETAYSLAGSRGTTSWHLWWSAIVPLEYLADGSITIPAAAMVGPASPPVRYWASNVASSRPQYVVHQPGGGWVVGTPAGAT